MPRQRDFEKGEISEISSASRDGQRGDWETVSNRSTSTISSSTSPSPIASPAGTQSPATHAADPAKKVRSPKSPQAKPSGDSSIPAPAANPKTNSRSNDKAKSKPSHKALKDKDESSPGRTTLEEYFHQQSKLFSNVEKRYNAFQQKVKDERERQRKLKGKK